MDSRDRGLTGRRRDLSSTVQRAITNAPPPSIWGYLTSAGPGIVFLVSSTGPSDLVSNSAAGANYGYSLLWTLLVIGAARFLVLEATARYVIATGESLLSGFRRVGAWTAWLVFGAIVFKRFLSNLYHIVLMGLAIGWLAGTDDPSFRAVASLGSCALAFLVMYAGGYRGVERGSKPLAVLLGATLVVTVAWANPDPQSILRGALVPVMPEFDGLYSPALVVLMLVGTGVGSLNNLHYSAFIFEKGWRSPIHLSKQRLDLITSVVGSLLMAALIQVAAAAVLRPAGLRLESVEDVIPMFTYVLGNTGRIVLSIGLWTTVFTTYMGSNTGYSLIAADIVTPVLGRLRETGKAGAALRARVYRLFLVGFCVPPLAVLWTDWRPVPLIILSSAVFAAALPVITLLLLRLTSDRQLMGDYRNGWPMKAALIGMTVVSLYVTYQTVLELITRHGSA